MVSDQIKVQSESSFYIKKILIRSRVRPGVQTTDLSIMIFIFGFYFRLTVEYISLICSLSKELLDKEIPEYVLKWGDHNNQLLQLFSDLLSSNTFTDVILEAKSKTFHAHQLVLSACSPFFRSLFITSQVSHQTVICKVRS